MVSEPCPSRKCGPHMWGRVCLYGGWIVVTQKGGSCILWNSTSPRVAHGNVFIRNDLASMCRGTFPHCCVFWGRTKQWGVWGLKADNIYTIGAGSLQMGLEFGMEMEKLRSREAYSMIISKLVWTRDKFHFLVFTNSLLNKMVINFYVLCLAWKTGLEAKASAVTLSH